MRRCVESYNSNPLSKLRLVIATRTLPESALARDLCLFDLYLNWRLENKSETKESRNDGYDVFDRSLIHTAIDSVLAGDSIL